MIKFIQMLASVLLLSAVFGCRATELAYDQNHIRSAVMGLHTDQIMDNLIRYRNGLPILQLDYEHMTGTVTDTASGTLSGSQTVAGTKSLTGPTSALAFSRALTNLFNYNVLGMKVNQLTVTAEPVTTSPDVYQAYDQFMLEPGHLMEDYNPPDPHTIIPTLVRSFAECGGSSCRHWKHHPVKYYWVPIEAQKAFRELAVHAVALRGVPVPSSPDFYVMVQSSEMPYQPDKQNYSNTWKIPFQIDRELPVDSGYMILTIKGIKFDKPDYLVVDAKPKEDLPAPATVDLRRTSSFILTIDTDLFKTLGIGITDITTALTPQKAAQGAAPAQGGGGQAGALGQSSQAPTGVQVGIHLKNHWPGMFNTENPAVGDIQNLLRLQYLSGLRNPGSVP